jgi:crotonobetainyl-CoA:carnitine CoA-transferase CaiB-like acyl-CoA transferase
LNKEQQMRPFEGIRVLDFTRIVSGPYCTQFLGFLGAEIIKIEDRQGDSSRHGAGDAVLKKQGMSATFLMFNAGKKSVTLDLKKAEAKEIVMKLARTADVFVENFRAGAVARLGFGYEALRKENPRIIYCSISGFGQTGPDAMSPAFDGNIQAMSGMMAMSGEPDGSPMRAGYSICDTGTGLNAALAVSAALYQRRDTGQGQFIDVAMLDSAISLASQTFGSWLNGGYAQPRRANLSVSHEPTSDVFLTAQGALMLAIMRDDHVMILLRLLGLEPYTADPRFATREARVANAAFIRRLVQAEMMKAPAAEWKRRMDEAGVPCSPILEIPEALSQPQVAHRGMVREVTDDDSGRTIRTLNAPFQYAHDGPAPSFPPQRLGASNEDILTELGYSKADIVDLAQREII